MSTIQNSQYLEKHEDYNKNDDFVYFGTKPKQREESEVKKRKIVTVEDQIATDAQGRRRFHGAFTGGFSAGYYNTCGSEEGWKPSNFVSSKTKRMNSESTSKPEDYMDPEDMMEYGIAPLQIKPTGTYLAKSGSKVGDKKSITSTDEKLFNDQFSAVPDHTMGFILLRTLGWKEGRGVGEKIAIRKDNKSNLNNDQKTKFYGCELPDHLKKPSTPDEDVVWISPQDTVSNVPVKKDNLFGLGYVDLRQISRAFREGMASSKNSSDDFKPCGNEKKGIRGSAFGIGAFEDEEDTDDVYNYDKLSNYTFGIEEVDEDESDNLDHSSKIKASSKLRECRFNKFLKVSRTHQENSIPTEYHTYLMKIPSNYIPKPILGPERTNSASYNTPFKKLDFVQKALTIGDISIGEAVKLSSSKPSESVSTEVSSVNPTSNHASKLEFKTSLASRFVSSGSQIMDVAKQNEHDDQLKACQMEMFGPLTRTIDPWQPESLLCRRFNVRCPVVNLPVTAISKSNREQAYSQKTNRSFGGDTKMKHNEATPQRVAHRPLNISGPLAHLNERSDPILSVSQPQKYPPEATSEIKPTIPISETEEVDVEVEQDRNFDMFAAIFGDDA